MFVSPTLWHFRLVPFLVNSLKSNINHPNGCVFGPRHSSPDRAKMRKLRLLTYPGITSVLPFTFSRRIANDPDACLAPLSRGQSPTTSSGHIHQQTPSNRSFCLGPARERRLFPDFDNFNESTAPDTVRSNENRPEYGSNKS